jgi:hypothetical protein
MGVPMGATGDSALTRSEESRIEFLDRELDISQTFLDVAELEAGDPERCETAEKNARIAYDTARTWIGSVRDADALGRLNLKLALLGERFEARSR